MRAGEFRRVFSAPDSAHALPKSESLARVVSRAGHGAKAHGVGLALVVTAKREKVAVLRTRADCAHDRAALAVAHVAERKAHAGEKRLRLLLLEDALAAVAQRRVRHLVSHHHGEARLAPGDGQDAGEDTDFPARQTEGIHLRTIHQRHRPGERLPLLPGLPREALGATADHLILRPRGDGAALAHDFAVALQTERRLLLSREAEASGAPSFVSERLRGTPLKNHDDHRDDHGNEANDEAATLLHAARVVKGTGLSSAKNIPARVAVSDRLRPSRSFHSTRRVPPPKFPAEWNRSFQTVLSRPSH